MGMSNFYSLTTPVTGTPLVLDTSSKDRAKAVSLGSSVATSPEVVEPSPKERLNRWFWKHLESWNEGDHAFVLIMVCLPLLERYLRHELEQLNGYPPGDLGSAPNFKQRLGALWGCTEADAEKCWNVLRNGLLHRGMMKSDGTDAIVLVRKQTVCVLRDGNQISVSPYSIRDKVIEVCKDNTNLWIDDEYPLAQEFLPLPPASTGKPKQHTSPKKKPGSKKRRRRH
jgi:hypothetical protein